jgi:hypothetical protein
VRCRDSHQLNGGGWFWHLTRLTYDPIGYIVTAAVVIDSTDASWSQRPLD